MGLQRRLRIYIGYDSPLIIRYLKPMTRDVFTARFSDCQFDKTIFPLLWGDKIVLEEHIVLVEQPVHELHNENEVRRIVHL